MAGKSKEYSLELQRYAAELIDEYGIEKLDNIPDDNFRVKQLRRLTRLHQEQTGCSWDTSRSHIARACRRAGGEMVEDSKWGGLREDNPGGRPPGVDKYVDHLRPHLYYFVMITLPMQCGADSTDIESFLAERKKMVHDEDIAKFSDDFRAWYRG